MIHQKKIDRFYSPVPSSQRNMAPFFLFSSPSPPPHFVFRFLLVCLFVFASQKGRSKNNATTMGRVRCRVTIFQPLRKVIVFWEFDFGSNFEGFIDRELERERRLLSLFVCLFVLMDRGICSFEINKINKIKPVPIESTLSGAPYNPTQVIHHEKAQ